MIQKVTWATAFVLLLAGLLLVSVQPVMAGSIGPIRLSDGVTVFSPVNTTYNTQNILLNYTFACGLGMHYSLNYTLDGNITGLMPCLLYTSDAADDLLCVDLGGRRII